MAQSPRDATLADRVATTSTKGFVGRTTELDLFRSLIAPPIPPVAVLAIHGPGGVGKSTLLTVWQRIAEGEGLTTIVLDGRALDPSPQGILDGLRRAFDLPDAAPLFDALPQRGRFVLLIDTFEALGPLDVWFRDAVIARLPADTLTVIAGRHPPPADWRVASGWDALVRTVPLRNLAPAESRAYLRHRGVPAPHVERTLAFTHGHPLALALVADFALRSDPEGKPFDPVTEPDVIRTLFRQFLRTEPSARHRMALEIAAHTRVTTESLLGAIFGAEEGHQLFSWLAQLSFIDRGSEGIYPHDLVRDVIEADLCWRHPERYLEVHRAVHRYLIQRIRQTVDREQARALQSLMFLHRNNPVWQPYHAEEGYGHSTIEPASDRDAPLILDMVRRHEGEASAAIARHWLARQSHGFLLVRAVSGEITGFLARIRLDTVEPRDHEVDPAVGQALAFVAGNGAARPGEEIPFIRFAMGNATYRTPATPMSISTAAAGYVYTHDNLAWFLVAVADPEYWEQFFRYVNFHRAPAADFTIDGHSWTVFAHDWRQEPIEVLDEVLTAREISTERHLAPAPQPSVTLLSQETFADAVRAALRQYALPGGLAGNPLIRSPLVARDGQRVTAERRLRALIDDTVTLLHSNGRTARYARALDVTYLHPMPTQEQAAESLDLPFSTYRRHLASGIRMLTAALWQRELESNAPASTGCAIDE